MKQKLTIAFLSLIICCGLFSCDHIAEDDRSIKINESSTHAPIEKSPSKKRVLLEIYTGWDCKSCPSAATQAKTLKDQYKDQLLVMCIHHPMFGQPSAKNNFLDLLTTEGTQFIDLFNIESLPSGVINRLKAGSSWTTPLGNWNTSIQAILEDNNQHLLDLNLGAKIADDASNILVSAQAIANKSFSKTLNISIAVLESQIIGVQAKGNETDPNYVFNNVLRKNGHFDNPLTEGKHDFSPQEEILKSYTIVCDTAWKIENCKILVLISDAETREIIQVNEIQPK